MWKSPEAMVFDSHIPLWTADISFENVSYVPLLPMESFDSGGHNGMILPNSCINDCKKPKKFYLRTKKKIAAGMAKIDEIIKKAWFTSLVYMRRLAMLVEIR